MATTTADPAPVGSNDTKTAVDPSHAQDEPKSSSEPKSSDETTPQDKIQTESVTVASSKPSAETVEKPSDDTTDKPSDKTGQFASKASRFKEVTSDFKKYRTNVKSTFTNLPESSDPEKIRKQVEFYFSDSNLLYDDYMRSLVIGNKEEKYGDNCSIPIKVIHTFKRMRHFQPYSAVVDALKQSTVLEVVGQDEIRRKVPYEKHETETEDPTLPTSIYAKGFPEETESTQLDIEEFFAPYGPIASVRLRRSFPTRVFKGSAFIEFKTEELQKAFLDMEVKPTYQGKELIIKSKKEYCDGKLEDIKAGKIKPRRNLHGLYKQYPRERPSHFRKDDRDHKDKAKYSGRGGRGRGGRGGRGGGSRRNDRNGRQDRDRNDRRRSDRTDDVESAPKDDGRGGAERASTPKKRARDETDDTADAKRARVETVTEA